MMLESSSLFFANAASLSSGSLYLSMETLGDHGSKRNTNPRSVVLTSWLTYIPRILLNLTNTFGDLLYQCASVCSQYTPSLLPFPLAV